MPARKDDPLARTQGVEVSVRVDPKTKSHMLRTLAQGFRICARHTETQLALGDDSGSRIAALRSLLQVSPP